MKISKRLLTWTIFAAICLFASSALADNWQWYECSVVKAGVGGGRYEFLLSGTNMYGGSPSGINSWYEIHPASAQQQKEILAILLTAASLGKKIEVLMIPEVTKSIYAIYLQM
jgi:hypothetical protein